MYAEIFTIGLVFASLTVVAVVLLTKNHAAEKHAEEIKAAMHTGVKQGRTNVAAALVAAASAAASTPRTPVAVGPPDTVAAVAKTAKLNAISKSRQRAAEWAKNKTASGDPAAPGLGVNPGGNPFDGPDGDLTVVASGNPFDDLGGNPGGLSVTNPGRPRRPRAQTARVAALNPPVGG